MRILSILTLFVLGSNVFAETKTYQFMFKNYPKSSAGCHAAAAEAGVKFTQGSGQAVKTARCVADDIDTYRILIEYEAEAPVAWIANSNNLSLYPSGQFKTLAACQAEVPALSQVFQKETGLAPTFAYCEGDFFSQSYPWYVRLDAFGTTARPPRLDGFLIFALPLNYAPGVYGTELTSALSSLGVTATTVRTHSKGGYAAISVHYYGKDRVRFDAKEITRSGKKEECLDQLASVKAALGTFDTKPLLAYCGTDMLGTTELTVVYPGQSDVRFSLASEVSATFADCLAGRDALVTKYQTELKLPVKGGVCTRSNRGYQVRMFEKI